MLDTKHHFLFDLDPCIRDNDECFTSNSLSAVTDVIPCHLITLNLNSSLSQGLESLWWWSVVSSDQCKHYWSENTGCDQGSVVCAAGNTKLGWRQPRLSLPALTRTDPACRLSSHPAPVSPGETRPTMFCVAVATLATVNISSFTSTESTQSTLSHSSENNISSDQQYGHDDLELAADTG